MDVRTGVVLFQSWLFSPVMIAVRIGLG